MRKNFTNNAIIQKESIALDTETNNGIPFLLADSTGKYTTDKNSMIEQLLSKDYKKTLNLFYNLGYDKNAILKLLSKKSLSFFSTYDYTIEDDIYYGGIGAKSFDIARANKIESIEENKGYTITLENGAVKERKNKPMTFLDYNNNEYLLEQKNRFFDLWQFFKYESQSSLDAVSQKYLMDNKTPIEELGYDKSNLYLDDTIIDYCIQDCKLTKQLSDIVINACNSIGILFNKPYSCATISADYFFGNQEIRNPFYFLYQYGNYVYSPNLDIFRYAYYAYKGGRSEVCKRGHFDTVYEYDVNSMYPSEMVKLYDCFKCDWQKITGEELYNYDINNIAYGFIKCNIKVPQDYVLPLPYSKGFYIYGYGDFNEYYLTIHELYMMFDLGIIDKSDVNIIDGWLGIKQNDDEYIFKDTIEFIYSERKKYDSLEFQNPLFKIILNSIYGRMIEVNINKRLDDTIDLTDTDSYDIMDNEVIKKYYTSGKYFNPIYACYITGMSRVKLFNAIYPHKESFVASFTDSVISTEKIKVPVSNELGDWEYAKGELTIIGSGVYRFVGKKEKIRTRGIHIKQEYKKQDINDNLYGINFDDLITQPFMQTKVMKLKESVRQDNLDDFNTFQQVPKRINLNFDKKRDWDSKFKTDSNIFCNKDILRYNDLSTVYGQHDSKAICIND
jgi:hypothetical protein